MSGLVQACRNYSRAVLVCGEDHIANFGESCAHSPRRAAPECDDNNVTHTVSIAMRSAREPGRAGNICGCKGRCGGSIRRQSTCGKGKAVTEAACATISRANRAIENSICKTMPCSESAITSACYLCNTHPKTDCGKVLEAVPLLRVQKSSVIVMLRRRGASRGRPVLGGSLKSLAFMRVCPKARSD